MGDEVCDDGNVSNHDACTTGCMVAYCGDGYTRIGVEQCDDAANGISSDGCTDDCLLGPCDFSTKYPP